MMKNKKEISLKLLLSMTLSLILPLIFVPTTTLRAEPAMPRGNAPMMPDLTPEQMEELQQELARVNEEMQAFVKTLPPEKQQEIAELEQAINQMSDEELEQLFEQLFTDENFLQELENMYPEEPMEQEPEAQPAYEPTPVVEKPIEKPKVEKNKIAVAAEMIQSLSAITDSLLSKLDDIPEIDDLVQNWIKKHQLRGWKKTVAWQDIKAQIDLFNQKLKKMLFKEPGSNEYRFLPDLVEDEALYNNLAHMENILKAKVSRIEVSPFGLEKLSKDAKAVMRMVLNKYAEGMIDLELIPGMNAIVEKHEPIAKQIREKEEALTKNAFEQSKVARTEKPVVIAGRPETKPGGYTPSRYQDYNGGYYPSSDYYSPSYGPSYGHDDYYDDLSHSEKPSAGGPAGAKAGGAAPAKGKEEGKEKDKEKKDEKDKDKKKKGDEKKKSKPEEQLESVTKKLKEANKACGAPGLLSIRPNLYKHGAVSGELSGTINEAVKKINAATSAVNDLGKTLADQSSKTQREYKTKVKTAYRKQAPAIGNIVMQLDTIKKNWSSIKKNANQAQLKAYGINFDAPDSKAAPATNMDAQMDQDEAPAPNPQADGNVQSPEEVMAQAQRAQAGLPAQEQAEMPATPPAQQAPQQNKQAKKAKTPQAAQPQASAKAAAPARDPELEKLMQEMKAKEAPKSLQGAIEALQAAIEKLAK